MIEISNLHKSYSGAEALAGFSLRVESGELCGLVGPNGAGKTTLIKTLATLIPADDGAASIDGLSVADAAKRKEVRHRVGYMPDHAGIYQEMRVEEFLHFFADAFALPREKKQAAIGKALDRAGLQDRRSGYIEELSMGMRQRLLLAKTLLHEPRVLLLDEPATGLDPLARIELRDQLRQLSKEGVTILLSSHILSDLDDICTRIAFIDEGRNAGGEDRTSAEPETSQQPPILMCEIEFVGDGPAALRAARSFANATVEPSGEGRLRAKVTGGPKTAPDLLRHLIEAGVRVTRFDPRGTNLEDRYRDTFGNEKTGSQQP